MTNTSQFAASLAVARAGLSATTLLDGHVLVAGGNDGHNDVAMAEIYDPSLASSGNRVDEHAAQPTRGDAAAREQHRMVAGFMSNGVVLKSAEQDAHWGLVVAGVRAADVNGARRRDRGADLAAWCRADYLGWCAYPSWRSRCEAPSPSGPTRTTTRRTRP